MPTFPSLPWQREGSNFEPIDDLIVDEWPNGGARGRSFVQGTRYRWIISLYYITTAEKDTLMAFYTANKLLPFDLVNRFDGLTYNNVIFAKPVIPMAAPAGAYWNCIVELRTR